MTTERSLICTPDEVRGLLRETKRPGSAGGRRQLRRLLKPGKVRFFDGAGHSWAPSQKSLDRALDGAADFRRVDGDTWTWTAKALPYQMAERTTWLAHIAFAPGDPVWVREHWWHHKSPELEQAGFVGGTICNLDTGPTVFHANRTFDPSKHSIWKAKPPKAMPRWASRLTLTITDVRIQRLQEITELDCIVEGPPNVSDVRISGPAAGLSGAMVQDPKNPFVSMTPRTWFREDWDTTNGAGSWDRNELVIALTFQPVLANVDRILKAAA